MTRSTPCVIGLDCGTGGARALVTDLAGRVLGQATSAYPTRYPRPGWAEQSPEDWWTAAVAAIRAALAAAGVSAADVTAISADGTSSTLVALDADLQPIGPAILWMDNRASAQARRMTATGDDALARCRAGVSSEWMLPRILWLAERRPAEFERTRWFVEMADYLTLRLSGRLTLGHNQATNRWFFDGRAGGWPTAFFARVGLAGIEERFPAEVLPLGTPVGPLCREAREATGLAASTRVVCGGTDAYVAMAGLDVCRPGKTALITGSSHLVLCQTDTPREIAGLFGPHPDCVVPGLFVYEGGQVSSLSIVKWWHDHFAAAGRDGDAHGEMMRAAAEIEIGADGLVALDFWQGNRNPYTDYDLQGAIWGLTLRHTPAHVLRALVEAIAYGTRNILAELVGAGIPVTDMTACGGAARSRFLLQMHADTTGIPIAVPTVTEATAFGSAIVAAVGAGAYGGLAEAAGAMVSIAETIDPDPATRAAYDEGFAFYRETHAALAPLMHRMAARHAARA